MKKTIFFLIILFSAKAGICQTMDQSKVVIPSGAPTRNFYEIQNAFHENEEMQQEKEFTKTVDYKFEDDDNSGSLQFGRWEEFMAPRVYPSGDITLPFQAAENYKRYVDSLSHGHILKTPLFPNTSNSIAGNWVSLGPSLVNATGTNTGVNGRLDFVRFDPANSNIMYTGSNTGGLWKSTNAGLTWNILTDHLPFIGCYDLAISNSNSSKMYMATGTVGGAGMAYDVSVIKSTDGGISWSTTGIILPSCCGIIPRLAIHPSNDDIVLAATFNGVYKTSDGGASWLQTQAGTFSDVKFKPGDPTIVYATQQGATTTRFYRSSNTGDTYTQTTSGLQSPSTDAIAYKIGVTPANPDYVYLVAMDNSPLGFNGIYRSTDGGMNFTTQIDSSNFMRILYSSEFMCITVNPQNANDVYIGGFAPYHSSDGGVTWAGIAGSTIYLDFHFLEFLPGSSTTIFAANDGGLYKSTSNGGSWSYLANGIQITQMYRMGGSSATPNKILTGQQDVGTYLYNNGVWSQLWQADGTECFIDPIDTNTFYMTSQNGSVYKSVNAGANFNQIVNPWGSGINSSGNWVSPFVMHPTDHNSLLIGKDSVYRSTNGGTNWSGMQGSSAGFWKYTALAYAPSNPLYIYAATSSTFYASTNGNNFVARTATFPGSITFITVSNVDPQKVWVSLSGYTSGNKVYASTDAGLTWNDYSTGLPNLPVNCIIYQNNTNDRLFVGMDVGVYYRSDSLSAWQYFGNGLPNVQVRDLEIHYSVNKIRAATFGRGLWESELSLVTGIEENKFSSDGFKLFPNPSSDYFTISISNEILKSNASLTIYNSLGELVYSQTLQNENTKIQKELPAGFYLAMVSNGVFQMKKKMIVHK